MHYLHLKLIKLDHHPCKRDPIPFLAIKSQLSDSTTFYQTRFVNSIPPTWEEKLYLEVTAINDVNLEISFLESRLLMKTEPFGHISIPLSVFPLNIPIIDWVPIEPMREYIDCSRLLVLFLLSDSPDASFQAEFGNYLIPPPWEKIEILQKDILEIQPNNENNNANQPKDLKEIFSSIFHHFQME